MQNQNQIRQQITQQIISALELDLVPWRRPVERFQERRPTRKRSLETCLQRYQSAPA